MQNPKSKIQNPNKSIKSKSFNYLLIGILFVICYLSFVISAPVIAKSAVDISVVSYGAKAMGMGRAGVAVVGSEHNAFVNPAASSAIDSYKLTSMSTQLLGVVDYRFVGGNLKTKVGTIGISYVGATMPAGFATTDENSLAAAQPINYGSSVAALSYGVKLNDLMKGSGSVGQLSLGANLKYHQQGFSGGSLSKANGAGYSADMAAIFQNGPALSFGVNMQNVLAGKMNWETGNGDEIPATTRAGAAYKIADGRALIAADLEFSGAKPMTFHGGIEWQPIKHLALRAGLDDKDVTAGVGMNFKGLQVDLAYRQDAALQSNSNFYLSLSYVPPALDETLIKLGGTKDDSPKAEEKKGYNLKPSHSLDYYQSLGIVK